MVVEAIEPMTPWNPTGPRWHVHLAPGDAVAEVARELYPVLAPYSQRMQILAPDRLHCTLAWIPERVVSLQHRLGLDADEIETELLDQLRRHVRLQPGLKNMTVPLLGLRWGKGGPLLRVDRRAAEPACRAAYDTCVGVAGSHWVTTAGDELHIALGYAKTTWRTEDVRRLDTELRAVLHDIDLPALPPQMLLSLQDTFAEGGPSWSHAHYT